MMTPEDASVLTASLEEAELQLAVVLPRDNKSAVVDMLSAYDTDKVRARLFDFSRA